MRALRLLTRVLAGSLVTVLLLALVYVALACTLMIWPASGVNRTGSASGLNSASAPRHDTDADADADADAEILAWVLSNSVHTDLVLPIRGHGMDWTRVFSPADLRAPLRPDTEFIAIGWGDREFYLHTPTWADLTIGRALGAAFGRHPAVLHVTYLRRADLGPGAYRLPMTAVQYAALREHVLRSLPNPDQPVVAGSGYGGSDVFYEARGRYSLFFTCNQWTGQALRAAGLAVPAWTPFDVNVTWQLSAQGE